MTEIQADILISLGGQLVNLAHMVAGFGLSMVVFRLCGFSQTSSRIIQRGDAP